MKGKFGASGPYFCDRPVLRLSNLPLGFMSVQSPQALTDLSKLCAQASHRPFQSVDRNLWKIKFKSSPTERFNWEPIKSKGGVLLASSGQMEQWHIMWGSEWTVRVSCSEPFERTHWSELITQYLFLKDCCFDFFFFFCFYFLICYLLWSS